MQYGNAQGFIMVLIMVANRPEPKGLPMKLLLHACCGPCSLEPVRMLLAEGHSLTIYYANSNIYPAAEYDHRLQTLLDWARAEGIAVVEGAYEPDRWEASAGAVGEALRKQSQAAEGGEATDAQNIAETNAPTETAAHHVPSPDARTKPRCRACYRLRFQEAARYAADHGFDGLATTLSVSPYQHTSAIEEELSWAAQQAGIAAVFEDFRPFYPAATKHSQALGMYRQNYCGCRFSLDEMQAQRQERKRQRDRERARHQAETAEERAREAERTAARKAERAAYDAKQARKRAILKELRGQAPGDRD